MNANGTPQGNGGYTVIHTAGSGSYTITFPPGTFTGNTGKGVIPVVTPGNVVAIASTPVAANGSGSFSVTFSSEQLFNWVVALTIQ